MAVTFHEGLPGSGKSYEAIVKHVLPALAKGRKVMAYVEGLDFDKFAQVTGLAVERVNELLVQLNREDMARIHELAEDNSLILLDEAQNFWPTGRQKLSAELTQFVAEHRHRGIDMILMGQSIKDVHSLWRRRVEFKAVYNKLNAIGADGRYNVKLFKAIAPEEFKEIASSLGKYDPQYFGLYKSHVSSDTNTENYLDKRANLLKRPMFTLGVPLFVIVLIGGVWTVVRFFNPPPKTAEPAPAAAASTPKSAGPAARAEPRPAVPLTPLEDLNRNYRPRLAMYFAQGTKSDCIVEWFKGDHLHMALSCRQIRAIGGTFTYRQGIAYVSGVAAMPWPRPSEQGRSVLSIAAPSPAPASPG